MAFITAAAIGAGGSLVGGLLGSMGAGKAAKAQQEASRAAIAEQRRQFDLARADRMPWLDQGRAGLYKLSDMLGIDSPGTAPMQPGQTSRANAPRSGEFGSLMQDFTGQDLASEPGYQFGMDQGRNTVDQSAAARGTLLSGSTLKDLMTFGQDYAGTKYGEAFNRNAANKNRKFSMLSGLSGGGSSAAADLGQAGMASAGNIGNLMTGEGNAKAAGIIGGANAWGNAIGSGVNSYMTSQYLNRLMRGTGNLDV